MLTSSIFSPSDCTAEALADFEKLVLEGGAVDPQGLTQRIRNAFRLLFLRTSDGQLVGVGALKHPGLGYRNRVFANAQATAASDEYRVEFSLSRRTRMFSRPPGPMSESCVMRLTMDSKSTGNPIRAGAATILFCIFVTRREVTFADFSGVRMLTVNRHGRYWLDFRCLANAMSLTS